MHVIGYTRVSTSEQGDSGGGLLAQRDAIVRECERRGWAVVHVVEDVASGGTPFAERPGGRFVLDALSAGKASTLMVARLDRLTRSLAELSGFLEQLSKGRLAGVPSSSRRGGPERLALVSVDVSGIDMTSPAGELVASVLGAASRMERRLIGARTSEALRAKQRAGLQLGRKLDMSPDVRALVLRLHAASGSPSATARELNVRGVPTARGGLKWRPSNVQRVVDQERRAIQPVRVESAS